MQNLNEISEKFPILSEEELVEFQGGGNHAKAFLGGAMTGAGLGALAGPEGVLPGALIGGFLGVIGSYL